MVSSDGIREKVHDGRNAVKGIGVADKITLHANEHSHDTESASAGGDLGLRGALLGHAAGRVAIAPEIVKGLLFDQCKQGGVADAGEFIDGVDPGSDVEYDIAAKGRVRRRFQVLRDIKSICGKWLQGGGGLNDQYGIIIGIGELSGYNSSCTRNADIRGNAGRIDRA